MPLLVELALTGVVLPMVLCAIFLALAWRPWKAADVAERAGFWGGALGLSAAYLAVHLAVSGVPELSPTNDLHWLAHMALFAGVIGFIEHKIYSNSAVRFVLRAAAIGLTYWLTLGFMVEHYWDGATSILALGGLTLVTLEALYLFDKMADRRRGALVPLAMTMLAAAGAVVLGLIGTARVAQMMGGLAAASGVTVLLAWWRPLTRTSRGAVTVFFVLFGGLLAAGYFNTQDWPGWAQVTEHYPTLAILLVASAHLALPVADADFTDTWAGWKRTLFGVFLLALPLAGSVYAANMEVEEEEEAEELEGVDYDSLY